MLSQERSRHRLHTCPWVENPWGWHKLQQYIWLALEQGTERTGRLYLSSSAN